MGLTASNTISLVLRALSAEQFFFIQSIFRHGFSTRGHSMSIQVTLEEMGGLQTASEYVRESLDFFIYSSTFAIPISI